MSAVKRYAYQTAVKVHPQRYVCRRVERPAGPGAKRRSYHRPARHPVKRKDVRRRGRPPQSHGVAGLEIRVHPEEKVRIVVGRAYIRRFYPYLRFHGAVREPGVLEPGVVVTRAGLRLPVGVKRGCLVIRGAPRSAESREIAPARGRGKTFVGYNSAGHGDIVKPDRLPGIICAHTRVHVGAVVIHPVGPGDGRGRVAVKIYLDERAVQFDFQRMIYVRGGRHCGRRVKQPSYRPADDPVEVEGTGRRRRLGPSHRVAGLEALVHPEEKVRAVRVRDIRSIQLHLRFDGAVRELGVREPRFVVTRAGRGLPVSVSARHVVVSRAPRAAEGHKVACARGRGETFLGYHAAGNGDVVEPDRHVQDISGIAPVSAYARERV